MGGVPHVSQKKGMDTLLRIKKFIYERAPAFAVCICASATLHNSRGSLLRKLKGARVASNITQQLHMYILAQTFVCRAFNTPGGDENTALRVPVWSNRSKEIRQRLFQHTLTDTYTRVPYAIDMYNLRKTVGCSLE